MQDQILQGIETQFLLIVLVCSNTVRQLYENYMTRALWCVLFTCRRNMVGRDGRGTLAGNKKCTYRFDQEFQWMETTLERKAGNGTELC